MKLFISVKDIKMFDGYKGAMNLKFLVHVPSLIKVVLDTIRHIKTKLIKTDTKLDA